MMDGQLQYPLSANNIMQEGTTLVNIVPTPFQLILQFEEKFYIWFSYEVQSCIDHAYQAAKYEQT